ncbi:unnamed protein product [Protopolystoma xenopodis]|uniref:Uncharacterized protein n=1 Tax=Protopolystoma xenopodis TaxID=117903 RepID=A0A3S5BAG8_9PLAT|nr:unnamed protein product [Protopolystoma xenopodis]
MSPGTIHQTAEVVDKELVAIRFRSGSQVPDILSDPATCLALEDSTNVVMRRMGVQEEAIKGTKQMKTASSCITNTQASMPNAFGGVDAISQTDE